jgi:hypothetical protein
MMDFRNISFMSNTIFNSACTGAGTMSKNALLQMNTLIGCRTLHCQSILSSDVGSKVNFFSCSAQSTRKFLEKETSSFF